MSAPAPSTPRNVTRQLIDDHLVDGTPEAGREIGLRIDQTLTQDATGTLVMLELEAMDLDRVRTEISAQYVDHNLVQEDFKNPDDHRFLKSAAERFGLWFSRPGNGVSHPVHQERFGRPGATLLGSDSHTPAAGAIGMLAFGAGGVDVALAMAGFPYSVPMPEVWGIELRGELPDWVSAKDVILELLRRHDVDGGLGRVLEYHGPGLASLSTMDRHVIANMGTELGATSTVFPSDDEVRRFLEGQGRGDAWREIVAEDGAEYDHHEVVDLSTLEPMIAQPSSPGNVVTVAEVAGKKISQTYVGSSANPGYRDFAVAAQIVADQTVDPDVSFDVNPTSRQILQNLVRDGHLGALIQAGARLHQAGCNGCIGMGQAPATDSISLRTVPRNFPGRSGTREDQVYLVSPETAAASALTGAITDPRTLEESHGLTYPRVEDPEDPIVNVDMLVAPLAEDEAKEIELERGPNIEALPSFDALPDALELPVIFKAEDDISTDEILPAGTRVLPYRSNLPKIAEFSFDMVMEDYPERARETTENGGVGHAVVGGENYGQGSSREHAALAPRYLGLRAVVVKSFARIHRQNLVNFGVLPLELVDDEVYGRLAEGATLRLENLHAHLDPASSGGNGDGETLTVREVESGREFETRHGLSDRQKEILLAGGVVNWVRENPERRIAA